MEKYSFSRVSPRHKYLAPSPLQPYPHPSRTTTPPPNADRKLPTSQASPKRLSYLLSYPSRFGSAPAPGMRWPYWPRRDHPPAPTCNPGIEPIPPPSLDREKHPRITSSSPTPCTLWSSHPHVSATLPHIPTPHDSGRAKKGGSRQPGPQDRSSTRRTRSHRQSPPTLGPPGPLPPSSR